MRARRLGSTKPDPGRPDRPPRSCTGLGYPTAALQMRPNSLARACTHACVRMCKHTCVHNCRHAEAPSSKHACVPQAGHQATARQRACVHACVHMCKRTRVHNGRPAGTPAEAPATMHVSVHAASCPIASLTRHARTETRRRKMTTSDCSLAARSLNTATPPHQCRHARRDQCQWADPMSACVHARKRHLCNYTVCVHACPQACMRARTSMGAPRRPHPVTDP